MISDTVPADWDANGAFFNTDNNENDLSAAFESSLPGDTHANQDFSNLPPIDAYAAETVISREEQTYKAAVAQAVSDLRAYARGNITEAPNLIPDTPDSDTSYLVPSTSEISDYSGTYADIDFSNMITLDKPSMSKGATNSTYDVIDLPDTPHCVERGGDNRFFSSAFDNTESTVYAEISHVAHNSCLNYADCTSPSSVNHATGTSPVNQPASPANQPASPLNHTTSHVNQSASPVNQTASPVNQTASHVNQTFDDACVPSAFADLFRQGAQPLDTYCMTPVPYASNASMPDIAYGSTESHSDNVIEEKYIDILPDELHVESSNSFTEAPLAFADSSSEKSSVTGPGEIACNQNDPNSAFFPEPDILAQIDNNNTNLDMDMDISPPLLPPPPPPLLPVEISTNTIEFSTHTYENVVCSRMLMPSSDSFANSNLDDSITEFVDNPVYSHVVSSRADDMSPESPKVFKINGVFSSSLYQTIKQEEEFISDDEYDECGPRASEILYDDVEGGSESEDELHKDPQDGGYYDYADHEYDAGDAGADHESDDDYYDDVLLEDGNEVNAECQGSDGQIIAPQSEFSDLDIYMKETNNNVPELYMAMESPEIQKKILPKEKQDNKETEKKTRLDTPEKYTCMDRQLLSGAEEYTCMGVQKEEVLEKGDRSEESASKDDKQNQGNHTNKELGEMTETVKTQSGDVKVKKSKPSPWEANRDSTQVKPADQATTDIFGRVHLQSNPARKSREFTNYRSTRGRHQRATPLFTAKPFVPKQHHVSEERDTVKKAWKNREWVMWFL